MKWQHFVLRVIVGSAIAIAFYFTTGFGSIVQTAAIAVTVSLGAQAAVLAVRRLQGGQAVSLVAVGGCALAAAGAAVFVVVIAKGPQEAVRFRNVDALMEHRGNVGLRFKVHGFVEQGSIQRRVEGGETWTVFVMHEGDKRVTVELRGPVPDTFGDRAEVVVTGHLRGADGSNEFLFAADEVMAKCPSTYNTKDGPRPAAEFR